MVTEYILIDGSFGEGGGQILRYSLAIASIMRRPVKIINIRVKRSNPGLQRQHLTAIRALAELTRARVYGAEIGSTEVSFEPTGIFHGKFNLDIGTAGSITLVLQSILPVIAFADSSVTVELKGGTDVPWSPTFDYFKNVMLYHLRNLGYEIELKLLRRGHYPRGGGHVILEVNDPPKGFKPIELIERGKILRIKGNSHCVRLPRHVAERQANSAIARLKGLEMDIDIDISIEHYPVNKDPHLGPGSGIAIWAETEKSRIGADSIGARDKRAEEVGHEAASKLIEDLMTGAGLDRHASDMIIPYLVFSNGISEITGAQLTMHAYTIIEIVKKIVPEARIEYSGGNIGKPFRIKVRGLDPSMFQL